MTKADRDEQIATYKDQIRDLKAQINEKKADIETLRNTPVDEESE